MLLLPKGDYLLVITIKGLLIGLLLIGLWCLQLPLQLDILVAFSAILVSSFTSAVNVALLTFGAWTGVIGTYVFLSITATSFRQYYREHEKFVKPGLVYESKVHEFIDQPHGDLVAIDPTLPADIRQPRVVEFVTDSRGYRNRRDYAGEHHILFGDSFLVGNGITQAETLPEVLRNTYGIPVYSMGHPQEPIDYERRAAWAAQEYGDDPRFSFLFYEGNDFVDPTYLTPPKSDFARQYDDFRLRVVRSLLGESLAPTTLYKFVRQVERRLFNGSSQETTVGQSGAQKLAHLNTQTAGALFSNPDVRLDLNPAAWRQTICVFFVPTKARIYPESVPANSKNIIYPAPSFLKLREKLAPLGVRVVDLTEPMIAAKEAAQKEGQLLFWKDDTHWNGRGVLSVAQTVADCLAQGSQSSASGTDHREIVKFDNQQMMVGQKIYQFEGDAVVGAVESISTRSYVAVFSGWAGDRAAAGEGVKILLVAGESVVGASIARTARADTAPFLGQASDRAGYEVSVPLQLYERHKADLKVYAISGRKARLLPYIGK
jgi:hypothetical protein